MAIKNSSIFIQPAAELLNLADWQEISRNQAVTWVSFIPVLAVRNPSCQLHPQILQGLHVTDSTFDPWQDLGTRYYIQVGTRSGNTAISPVPTPMKLSDIGVAFLKAREGLAKVDPKTGTIFPYKDSAGNPTIGWGHLIHPNEDFSKGITVARAQQILDSDIAAKVSILNSQLTVRPAQNQFDAILSLVFDAGAGSAATLNIREPVLKLNAGAAVIETDFTQYDKDKGKDGKKVVDFGLLKRRKLEWKLFSQGDYAGAS